MYYLIWQFGIANCISGGDFSSFSFIRGKKEHLLGNVDALTFWELYHWLNNNGQSSWHYFLKVRLLLTSKHAQDTRAMVKCISWAYLIRKTIETWSGMQKCILCEQKLSTNCIIKNGYCKLKKMVFEALLAWGVHWGVTVQLLHIKSIKLPSKLKLMECAHKKGRKIPAAS